MREGLKGISIRLMRAGRKLPAQILPCLACILIPAFFIYSNIAFPVTGWAQENLGIKRFGDWEVLCDNVAGTGAEKPSSPASGTVGTCRAVQRLTVKETGEAIFVLTVLPGDKAGLVAIASIPLGGYLVPGVEVTVDGKKPYRLLVETCTVSGCHAGFPLSEQASKDLRTGKIASFRIWSSKSQSTEAKVSLNGFADVVAYLERRP